MKTLPCSLPLLALLSFAWLNAPAQTAVPAAPDNGRLVFPFDSNWHFYKGDAKGADQASFDDSAWRTLDVPHDWSIEGPYDQTNPTGSGGGYLPAGIGWYRKSFTLPASDSSSRVCIAFDGIMSNSDVYINGFHVGARPYGYVEQYYDLTGHLNFGSTPNVLAVRVDNSIQPLSRYYTASGIYRHVRLVVTNPIHIEHWGVFVTTPQVTPALATVHVQTTVVNGSNQTQSLALVTTLLGPDGDTAATAAAPTQSVAAGQTVQYEQDIPVSNPQLWDLATPNLYQASVQVLAAGQAIDNSLVTFGIRSTEFKPDTGFWLNGKNIKIKGVCLHQDAGAVGEAVPSSLWERRLLTLKSLGANAIRWSHNPPSPELLNLCDRLGLLVMDEMFDTWTVAKTGPDHTDYSLFFDQWSLIDLRDTVLRDRNHPSIILYSAGNEIHDTPQPDIAIPILKGLVAEFHKYDPTRPVTQALLRPNGSHDYTDGLADLLDVIGTNYRNPELIAARHAKPSRKIINTEDNMGYDEWRLVRDNPDLSGQFLWSGIDYLGEARWPAVSSMSGLLDRAGQPKALAFERQSWWSDQPVVHLARLGSITNRYGNGTITVGLMDWSPKSTATHNETVVAYSNADEVELFLNGQSLGAKKVPSLAPRTAAVTDSDVSQSAAQSEQQTYQARNVTYATPQWEVPFAPGVLKVVARKNGQVVGTDELRTAGAPAKLTLEVDRTKVSPDFEDVAFVTATVTDADGTRVPSAAMPITFKLDGPGKIIAVDNAVRSSDESYTGSSRKAGAGRAYAVIRATAPDGKITITASADGLTPASACLAAAPAP